MTSSLATTTLFTSLLIVSYVVIPWLVGHVWRRTARFPDVAVGPQFTFDDEPDTTGTPKVLDVLGKHSVKAIFFVVGKKVEKNKDLLLRILQEGHTVGFHGYSHRFPWLHGPIGTYLDMVKEEKVLHPLCNGSSPNLYRPPYGKMNLASMALSFLKRREIVYWTVDPQDYTRSNATEIHQRVMDNLNGGSIVLLHDGGYHCAPEGAAVTANALDLILTDLRNRRVKKECPSQ